MENVQSIVVTIPGSEGQIHTAGIRLGGLGGRGMPHHRLSCRSNERSVSCSIVSVEPLHLLDGSDHASVIPQACSKLSIVWCSFARYRPDGGDAVRVPDTVTMLATDVMQL
jgi:hypothetical protein